MDWKILVFVLVLLVVFVLVQKCGEDDAPDFDRIQAQQEANRRAAFNQKRQQETRDQIKKLQASAREARKDRPEPETIDLETEDFKAVFTTRGGGLKSLTMKDPQYLEAPRRWETGLKDEDAEEYVPVDLVTTNTEKFELSTPLRFDLTGDERLGGLLSDADYEIYDRTGTSVVFRYAQPGTPVEIYKKFETTDTSQPYLLWVTVRVTNIGDQKVSFRGSLTQHGYQHESEAGGSMFAQPPNLLQGICRHGGETRSFPWNDDDLNQPFTGIGEIGFVGVQTNYFIGAMIPEQGTPATCQVSKILDNRTQYPTHDMQPWGHVVASLRFGEVELNPGESKIFRVKNYMGPKRYQLLQQVGNRLEESVDFGFFWPICQVLLKMLFFFQAYVVNWGVAIILLTIVVKVVLMPLTHRSFESSNRMKALKPEVDKINEKYKNDMQAKQQATMALYKQHKINPLGGCLPMLLQMPIWIALFSTLRTSPELYRAPFFGWITDLSSPDPYFVTPIVMGAMMFLQNKFTPMAGDAMQAKMMMYFMPVMFTAMMLFLPSGLTLYILVNTVLSIAHQMFIHRRSRQAAGA
ncbi:MAG: membrane protein insertase YidC [Myxococcota bacterium]|nr:membrane protein insertase YidC [Myxococcota bacterium]